MMTTFLLLILTIHLMLFPLIMSVLLGKALRPMIVQASFDMFNPCLASKQLFTLNGI